jgi:type IV pilus assembly protein PilC
MPSTTYAYRVRDREGKIHSGSLEAENTALVANKLRQMGYVPISIDKKAGPGVRAEVSIPILSNRVKLAEIAVFARQFATMISSGLTLLRSLSILSVQTSNKHFANIIDQVRNDIESGSSLSQALSRHPKQFNNLFVAMVRAGETSGNLDRTLSELSEIIEKQVELRGKIRSALAYPAAVLSLVVLILGAMLIFIVPIFKGMYASLGGKLPAPTLLLISVSNIVVTGFPFVIVSAIAGIFLYRRWVKTPAGKGARDRVMLKVPIFGGLVRKTSMARFSGTLSTLLSSGVPVLEALEITADTVGNAVVAEGVHSISEGAKRGEPLTRPLMNHPVFPPMVTQMMAVGEETGALDTLLRKVSRFYEDEVQRTVDALTSLLEPLLIVVLGGAVGSMVISLYLPMFDIIKLVGNNN